MPRESVASIPSIAVSPDRAIDLALASGLALLPLLPAGASHLGLAATWWPDAWVLALAGCAVWLARRRDRLAPAVWSGFWSREVVLATRGYAVLLIAATGAALAALAIEGGFGAALDAGAAGTIRRLLRPMDLALDPLYPARVWLTMAEGAVAFAAVSIVVWGTADPARRVRTALAGCLTGLAVVSSFAIVQYVTRFNLHPYWLRMNARVTRSHSTLDDPNALGSFLLLGLGVAIGVWWASRGHRGVRAVVAAVALLALGALVTTVSRSAWLALPVAFLLSAALGPDLPARTASAARAVRRVARGILMAVAVVSLLWVGAKLMLPSSTPGRPTTSAQVIVQTVDPRTPVDRVLKQRVQKWRAALAEFGESPLVGVGLGRYPRLYGRTAEAPRPENTHNFFLQMLAEAGLAGLAALLVFMILVAKAVREGLRNAETRPLAAGLGLGLTAFALTWLAGHPLLTVSNQVWLGVLLAIVLGAAREVRTQTAAGVDASHRRWWTHALRPSPQARRWWVAGLAVYALLLSTVVGSESRRAVEAAAMPGVYAWEDGPRPPPGIRHRRFRWTRREAVIRVPVEGPFLRLPFYLARPDLDDGPLTIDLSIEGRPVDRLSLAENGWHVWTYDVREWEARPEVAIHIAVDRTFVPAHYVPTVDSRELGIGLGVPMWRRRP